MEEQVITAKETARLLRISTLALYRGIKRGKIPIGQKVGNRWRFVRNDVISWLLKGRPC